MGLGARVSLIFAVVAAIGFFVFVDQLADQTKRHYREATEEPLVDMATVLAALVAEHSASGPLTAAVPQLDAVFERSYAEKLDARIYDLHKTRVDLRVYLTDARGVVLFDSWGRDVGRDYSGWHDVQRTLRGHYGARMSHAEFGKTSSLMYVAAPVRRDGRTIGALTVGKPTRSADTFIRAARRSTTALGVVSAVLVITLATALALFVTAPIGRLTRYLRDLRDGRRVAPPRVGGKELQRWLHALEQMREAVEGRAHLERYVQTLTHELKSPLAGIRGAVELLRDGLPPEQQQRFLANVEGDVARIQRLSEKLMALASLQRQVRFEHKEALRVQELADELQETLAGALAGGGLTLRFEGDPDTTVEAQRFWLREALLNLLQNAIDFAPPSSAIDLSWQRDGDQLVLRVRDHGPGVPPWAADKVFDPFFSLARPGSGRRSTGLGLKLVREIAELHGGQVTLRSQPDGGALAELRI